VLQLVQKLVATTNAATLLAAVGVLKAEDKRVGVVRGEGSGGCGVVFLFLFFLLGYLSSKERERG